VHVEPAAPPAGAGAASAGAAVPWSLLWAVARILAALALVLLATTWPISDFQDHPHWFRVEWIPFSEYQRPFDVVANVLLFVPFGAAAGASSTDPRRVRLVMSAALVLALGVELSQVYTHNRIATTTDVVTNTAGAWLGARWAITRARTRARAGRAAR
jgi:glycopeptide antibiotics resistance protein